MERLIPTYLYQAIRKSQILEIENKALKKENEKLRTIIMKDSLKYSTDSNKASSFRFISSISYDHDRSAKSISNPEEFDFISAKRDSLTKDREFESYNCLSPIEETFEVVHLNHPDKNSKEYTSSHISTEDREEYKSNNAEIEDLPIFKQYLHKEKLKEQENEAINGHIGGSLKTIKEESKENISLSNYLSPEFPDEHKIEEQNAPKKIISNFREMLNYKAKGYEFTPILLFDDLESKNQSKRNRKESMNIGRPTTDTEPNEDFHSISAYNCVRDESIRSSASGAFYPIINSSVFDTNDDNMKSSSNNSSESLNYETKQEISNPKIQKIPEGVKIKSKFRSKSISW